MRNWKLTSVALVLGALVAPASAGASVQIGTDLALGEGQSFNCNNAHQCTTFMSALSPSSQAPGGLTSPVSGTVTGFQVNNGPQTSPLHLRVLRPFGGNLFSGAGTGPAVTPPINQISPLLDSGNLPISIGDSVGLECCQSGTNAVVFPSADPVSRMSGWGSLANPPLPDNAPPSAPDSNNTNQQLMLRAEVEPTNTFALGSPTRTGRRVTVEATVPNPGVVAAILPPKCCKKKLKPQLTAPPVTATAPGKVSLILNITKKTANTFSKFKQSIPVRYTPTFGQAGADQSVRVSYKRKKRKNT